MAQNAAPLMPLADIREELVSTKPWTEPPDIEEQLRALSGHMERVITKYLHNRADTIESYNEQAREIAEPYRLLIVFDFPHGFDERSARRLESIAANGPRCGVHVLMTIDTEAPLPHGFELAGLERASDVIEWENNRFTWKHDPLESLRLTLDEPPPPEKFSELLADFGPVADDASEVVLDYWKIAPEREDWWQGKTTDGIRVPIGMAGARKVHHFELGTEPLSVNALVGGRPDSGKSNLLHVLIANAALQYPPGELELYLVDFKEGVEFKPYAYSRDGLSSLPHARVVAIESEREFGLSCLEAIGVELEKRGQLLRESGHSNLWEYRAATAEVIPRILLIVDEFQKFFDEDDVIAQRAEFLIDDLTRRGRAFGVHLLLVTQNLSGRLQVLRRSMGQIAVRIALACDASDSRVILSEDNPKAATLTRRGEAVYNNQGGRKDVDVMLQVARIESSEREDVLERVRELSLAQAEPMRRTIVFDGNANARLEDCESLAISLSGDQWPAESRPMHACLGAAIAIGGAPGADFSHEGGKHLLIIGREAIPCVGMLSSAVLSLAAQRSPDHCRFVFLDFMPPDSGWSDHIQTMAVALPHDVILAGRGQAEEAIETLAAEIARRSDDPGGQQVYVVGFSLQRFRALRHELGRESPLSAATESILREGADSGVHFLAWWDSRTSFRRSVDRRCLQDFGIRVALPMSRDDSSELLDSPAASRLEAHRALLWTEEASALEKFIPFEPASTDFVKAVGNRLAGWMTREEH